MKTIGLLGGMSWESTAHYYTLLNQGISSNLGGLHSAKIIMESVDFYPLEEMMKRGDWATIGEELTAAAKRIETAGADCLLICTNTMHKVAPQVEGAISIPLIHIADATGEHIFNAKISAVGLLGTSFTMEEEFYRERLQQKFGFEVIIPDAYDRAIVDEVIFNELCRGVINEKSRKDYLRIMNAMQRQGAQAIIEGCTEINSLVNEAHTDIPIFDTTSIHVGKALEFALEGM